MTTKFLDNKICTFKILLSWRFPRKTAFLDNSPLYPHARTPLESANFIIIVVSQSLTFLKKCFARAVFSEWRCAGNRFGTPTPAYKAKV